MTLSALARLLLRRWYIALLGLLMTGALAAAALHVVKPEYDAAGSILLLPPAEPGANPYLDLAAVPGVPEVVSRVLHDSKYADKYDAAGIKDYEVAPDQSAGGPAVLVIGKGPTGAEALAAMQTVMGDVLPVLQDLQDNAGVETPNLITGRQIYVETEATKVGKKQTRALIATVGLGVVATLALVLVVDGLLVRLRSRRRERRSEDEASAGGDDPPSPDPEPMLLPEPTSLSASRRSSRRSPRRPSQHPSGRR